MSVKITSSGGPLRLNNGILMKGPRAQWATLLRRSHDIDVLACPKCGRRLRLLAVITDESQAARFVAHLEKSASARSPPAAVRDPRRDVA